MITFWFLFSVATASLVWGVVEHKRRCDIEMHLRRRDLCDMVAELEWRENERDRRGW